MSQSDMPVNIEDVINHKKEAEHKLHKPLPMLWRAKFIPGQKELQQPSKESKG